MNNSYNKNDLGKSFGLAVAVMLGLQLLLTLVFFKFYDIATNQFDDWAYWTMQAIYAVGLGSVAFIYAKISKTNMLSACKIKAKPPIAHIGWGCLATAFLIACMLPVNEWFLDLFELMGLNRPTTNIPTNLPTSVLLPVMLLVVCVIPAFTEEFVFRGTVSATLQNDKNKLASLAICGGLFALFHLSAAQTVHQFVLGAFLALLYFRSGSIWTTVCVHFFNNLVAVILMFTASETVFVGQYAWVFALVGAVGFTASVVGYLFTTKSKWQTADNTDAPAKMKAVSLALFLIAVAVCLALWIMGLFQ